MRNFRIVSPFKAVSGAAVLAVVVLWSLSGISAWAASCDSLKGLKIENTTITTAEEVPAGAFKSPATGGGGQPGGAARLAAQIAKMPAFCRVAGETHPVPGSDIKFEVWMPLNNWNGRFEAVGNGGLAGTISYQALVPALTDGYATASTDTGHTAPADGSASWALGHPEAVVDFGYRAVHEMTVMSKAVIAAFYGSGPKYSYWNGCSEGGRQGMGEAQKFPTDFNGILAGAPVFHFTHGQSRGVFTQQLIYHDPAAYIPVEKYKLIQQAVLDECDAADGVKDGVINNPLACHFDPAKLLCKNGDAPDCLTASQVKEMKSEYQGAVNPRTGESVVKGHAPGFEFNLVTRPGITPDKLKESSQGAFYKYMVFENPNWDWTTLDFDKDIAFAEKKLGAVVENYDPDLSKFKAAGGKLLQYHGWADGQPSPYVTVDYFEMAQKKVGDTSGFYRLFMIPGMGHCSNGPGTDQFDKMGSIVAWVEQGKAPDQVIASHQTDGKVDRTRPLCPFPQVAKYKGTGSTDEAANFVCAKPN